MNMMSAEHDRPMDRMDGLAARRERMWGLVGGLVGAVFGVGSALIAVLVEGAPWFSSGGYPDFFASRRLLVFDGFLLGGLVAGLAFVTAGGVFARFGRYPRTDAFGGALTGTILAAISGSLIFLRLVAVIRGLST